MSTCHVCGKPLVWTGRGRPPTKYCSPQCKVAGINQKQRAVRLAEAGERHCLECGTVIPDSVTLKAKCCSRECSVAYQNRKRADAKRVSWAAEELRCQRCGNTIPVPEQGRRRTIYCSDECKKQEMDARWRERSPHYMREYLYGLSQEQYEALLLAQDGRCAICGSPDWPAPIRDGSPHVDHDHGCDQGHPPNRACGRCVRGLLCGHCNNGIGQLDHDPARLRAAADYLERKRT